MLNQPKILSDRYRILRTIAKKPGRQTLFALDREIREFVIIKVVEFGRGLGWEHFKLFEREAKTLQGLSHPAIPKYLNYFEIGLPSFQGFALVQTYINARSLKNHIEGGRTFTEAEIKQIARQLLEILTYLHDRHPPIIHRDLKPSNILLENRSGHSAGEVYLVDFGSVQNFVSVEDGTFTIVGTYGYMPPEQFIGRAVPTSDLYSLGATLIYLLTGKHPADLPSKDGQIQLNRITNLSSGFSHWLKKMTEPTLEKRFSSAQMALEELKRSPKIQNISTLTSKAPITKYTLIKNYEEIQVLIPGKGFDGCGTIASALFSYFLISLATVAVINWLWIGWVITGFALWFLVELWRAFIFEMFGKTELYINKKEIGSIYKIFGLQFHLPPPSLRNSIFRLERVEPHIKRQPNPEGSGYTHTSIPGSVVICADRNYELKNLTLEEVDWLCMELSDWLALPIQNRKMHVIKVIEE
ncbi:MAG: serine/threonine protein kinase [Cyanosarcina radialis HA8281-LM2]|jgi:serine/threonine protein kinase|nr:serine/threonine protein kinase [Cyanosarcina radialis HA8281-LM2]